MILLPLGPKGRLPDYPLMAIAVGLCTVAFSIYSFQSTTQVVTRTMKHEGYRTSLNTAQDLAQKWCDREQLGIDDCLRLQKTASGLNLISEEELFSRLTAFKSKTVDDLEPLKTFFKVENEPKLKQFSSDLMAKLAEMPEYAAWREYIGQTYHNGHWLTQKTITAYSVLKAQFTHAGWLHLVSNMIFFFAFAGALEMRIGMIGWLAIYFIGGSSGLILYARTTLPEGIPLLGASASVTALAGAYLILFWKHPTRVLLSLILYNKVVLIPTFAFVLLSLVGQDIAGSLNPEGSTAYLAHLVGFGFGCIYALGYKFFIQSEMPFLYPHEQEAFEEAQDSPEALALYDQILVWNPENVIVRDLAFAEITKEKVPAPARLKFLEFHLSEVVTQLRRDKDYERLNLLVQELMVTTEAIPILKLLSEEQVTFILETLVDSHLESVASQWAGLAADAYPELKRNEQFRSLARPFIKKSAEAASA